MLVRVEPTASILSSACVAAAAASGLSGDLGDDFGGDLGDDMVCYQHSQSGSGSLVDGLQEGRVTWAGDARGCVLSQMM